MSDDKPTREIEGVSMDHYDDGETWVVLKAAGDKWPVKWDLEYGQGLIRALLEHYGLEYDDDPANVDTTALIGSELPVRENEYGDWKLVRTDVFHEVDYE